MNKRKMRMMGMVLAGVLAMTPFLHGCATDDGGSSNDNGSQNSTEQQEQNGSEQQNTGSQGDVVYYGQVMGVNGNEITVVLGDLSAADGEGLQKFEAQEDEVTFNKGDVVIVDESGAVVDDPTVSADQIVVMSGSGDGPDFRPSKLEILQSNADGAVSSAAAEQGLDQKRPLPAAKDDPDGSGGLQPRSCRPAQLPAGSTTARLRAGPCWFYEAARPRTGADLPRNAAFSHRAALLLSRSGAPHLSQAVYEHCS